MSQQPPTKAVEWSTMWTMWTVIFMTGRNTVTHSWLTNFTHHRSTGVSCQRHEVLLLWCWWKCFRCSISVTSRAGGMQVNTWISMNINVSNMNHLYWSIFIYDQCTVAPWHPGDFVPRVKESRRVVSLPKANSLNRGSLAAMDVKWPQRKQKEWVNDDFCWWTGGEARLFLVWDSGVWLWYAFKVLVADHFWNVCTTLM